MSAELKQITPEQKKRIEMQAYVKQMEPEIKKALPSIITPERFTRIVLSAMSSTPKLFDCTRKSFLAAMMSSAQLGLEPNTPLGQAYLIPYRNHGQLECTFQLGYRGMLELAHRAGVSVHAHVVYDKDEFSYCYGLNPDLKHVPAKDDRGEAIFYYAVYRTKEGDFGFEVMSAADIDKHAQKYSQAYTSSESPWKKHFDEMALKTVIKKVLKYAPLQSEFARAIASDETIKTEIDKDMSLVPPVVIDGETVETVEPESADESSGALPEKTGNQVSLNDL